MDLQICQKRPKDQKILLEAQEKHKIKKKIGKLEITKEKIKIPEQTKDTATSFAATSLGTFKSFVIRRVALSARLGILDRRPPREDQKHWESLISSRREYLFAARTIQHI